METVNTNPIKSEITENSKDIFWHNLFFSPNFAIFKLEEVEVIENGKRIIPENRRPQSEYQLEHEIKYVGGTLKYFPETNEFERTIPLVIVTADEVYNERALEVMLKTELKSGRCRDFFHENLIHDIIRTGALRDPMDYLIGHSIFQAYDGLSLYETNFAWKKLECRRVIRSDSSDDEAVRFYSRYKTPHEKVSTIKMRRTDMRNLPVRMTERGVRDSGRETIAGIASLETTQTQRQSRGTEPSQLTVATSCHAQAADITGKQLSNAAPSSLQVNQSKRDVANPQPSSSSRRVRLLEASDQEEIPPRFFVSPISEPDPLPLANRGGTSCSSKRRWKNYGRYTKEHQQKMLDFIIKHEAYERVKGRSIFQEMFDANLLPGRTVFSMESNMKNHVLNPNEIGKFNLTAEQRGRFISNMSSYRRKK